MNDRDYEIWRLAGYVWELVRVTCNGIEAWEYETHGYTVVERRR